MFLRGCILFAFLGLTLADTQRVYTLKDISKDRVARKFNLLAPVSGDIVRNSRGISGNDLAKPFPKLVLLSPLEEEDSGAYGSADAPVNVNAQPIYVHKLSEPSNQDKPLKRERRHLHKLLSGLKHGGGGYGGGGEYSSGYDSGYHGGYQGGYQGGYHSGYENQHVPSKTIVVEVVPVAVPVHQSSYGGHGGYSGGHQGYSGGHQGYSGGQQGYSGHNQGYGGNQGYSGHEVQQPQGHGSGGCNTCQSGQGNGGGQSYSYATASASASASAQSGSYGGK